MKTLVRILAALLFGLWGYAKAHHIFGLSIIARHYVPMLACYDCPVDLYLMKDWAPWSYVSCIAGFVVYALIAYWLIGYVIKASSRRLSKLWFDIVLEGT